MLPLKNRLPLRTTRRAVESVAKNSYSSLLTILITQIPERNTSPSRFAVILSKKISKLAVTRNLVRRQTLASIQLDLASIKPGFDVIIIPKKSIIKASFEQIRSDVHSLLQKANLL